MTRDSWREIEARLDDLDGGERLETPAETFKEYRDEARQRLDRDDYASHDGEDGGPILRLWDAYAVAYGDDVLAWEGARRESFHVMSAEDPRPEHLPPAPAGYDGALPVPTERVGDAIEAVEWEYDVRIKRLDSDTVPELPDSVDSALFGGDLTVAMRAGTAALAKEARELF